MSQQKALIAFRIISHQKKQKRQNIQQQELNQGIFYQIYPTWESTWKIFTMILIILFSMFVGNKKYKFIFTDRKLDDQNKHKMIYMRWKECMPQGSTRKRPFFILMV